MRVYWHECGQKHGNLGDQLTPLLLDYFGVANEWSPPERADLLGIGSLLHRIPRGYRGIVWSTGALFSGETHDLSASQVLALRGRLTLSQVKCREPANVCLGDGGLLASLFFHPCQKRFKLGVIPHYAQADNRLFKELEYCPEIKRIDICDEPRSVIQQIGQCEHILSSSLHGLIVADSLGIPNRWIDVSGDSAKILGSGFKFRDYYSNFGFGDLEPALLRPGNSLEELLPLFEGYRRPSIDDLKANLLESLRSVVAPRSCYRWERAKQDIVQREGAINQRLEHHGRRPMEAVASAERRGSDANSTKQYLSFDDVRELLKRDAHLLGEFLLDCLSQIQKLHEAGIAHGDIRDKNIFVVNGKPILANPGWCVPSEDADSLPDARLIAADLRALGALARDLAQNHPHYVTIASLLMQAQPDRPLNNAAAAHALTHLLMVNNDDVRNHGLLHAESEYPAIADALLAVKTLLEVIAERDRDIASLRAELESSRKAQWRAEVRAASLQLAQIIPENATYVFIDGDEWRSEFGTRPRSLPFVERNGTYWGPPADDESAVRELRRLQGQGAQYVAFGKPAFWWLEYYSGFHDYLNSSADCCHDDELLVVYRLQNNGQSSQM